MSSLMLVAQSSSSNGGSGAGVAIGVIVALAFVVLMIAALWVIFANAGQRGWLAIIPIINYYVILRMVGRPGWWIILYFIPFVNIVVMIIVMLDLARVHGKGVGFGVGLILLPIIFLPMLAWGSAEFRGDRTQVL